MTRSIAANPCSSRAPKARCWISTTEPILTSPRRMQFQGARATGLGVAPTRITGVVGVTKAYTTRVGSGPFPTEMPDLDAQEVRARGNEFGAVTGRPRRCGWLDLVVLRYAKMLNGIDSLVVTKLDVFDEQPEIKVCTGYRHRGQPIAEMPPGRGNAQPDRARIQNAAGMEKAHAGDSRRARSAHLRARLFEFYFRPAANRNRNDFDGARA